MGHRAGTAVSAMVAVLTFCEISLAQAVFDGRWRGVNQLGSDIDITIRQSNAVSVTVRGKSLSIVKSSHVGNVLRIDVMGEVPGSILLLYSENGKLSYRYASKAVPVEGFATLEIADRGG